MEPLVRQKPAHALVPGADLGERDLAVWHGNYYAVEIMDRLGLAPEGAVRAGFVHYNTEAEVDRLLAALAEI